MACVALLVSGSLLAAPDLEGGNVTTGPGQEVSIPVNFTADGSVVALQFDLTYDATVLSPTAMTPGTALVGHSFDWQQVQPGRLRFIITAGVQTPLVDGSLLDLGLLTADTASAGNYPLVISNVVLSNGTAQRIAATGTVDGSVVIELPPAPAIPIPTLGPVGTVLLILLIVGFILVIHQRGFGGVTLSVFLGIALFSSTIARAVTLPGDANNDGVVDANDVPAMVAQILERADAPGNPDCNEDAAVDVLDTICVQQASAPPPPPPGQNSAPDLVPPGNRSLQADTPFETPIFATDPDVGDVLTFSLPAAPAGMSIHPSSGILSWSPGAGDLGGNNVTAMVMDSGGLTDSEVFSIEVFQPRVEAPANVAPVLVVPGDQGLVFNTLLGIQASATDADVGDTLTFELINAPSGMSIDPATGAITWTPTEPQIGEHDVAVRVTDTAGAVDVGSFIVTVNDINKPPVAVDDLYTAHGTETLVIPPAGVLDNDSDPNGDPMTTQLVTAPANGSLTLNSDGSFEYVPISPTSNLEATPVTGDMAQRAEPVSINSSSTFTGSSFTESDDREAFRALDGDLDTSWFVATGDAVNLGSSPFYEIGFAIDVTVTEIQMFGNRESPDGFDFLAGIFQLFDESGAELFNSGDLTLPAPDRDIVVAVPSIELVRKVRFTPTADESDRPGFAELKVMGSAVVRLFKSKTNIELTRFARFTTSASSNRRALNNAEKAADQRLQTSWHSEDSDLAPGFEVTFPDQGVTVREIDLFGPRFSSGNPDGNRQFLTGEFRLLDAGGIELWTSGVVTLTDIHNGFVLPVPAVADVRTVRFEGVTWNHATLGPGLSEFKVFGDGLIWPLYPKEEWSWTETSMLVDGVKAAGHVSNVPLVVDLDGDGFQEILFSAGVPFEGITYPTYIVILDGRTGAEKQVLLDPDLRVRGYVSMAVGDIDGDGLPEILAAAEWGSRSAPTYEIIAFEHDLTLKWRSDPLKQYNWAGITIANIDGQGLPEILIGDQALDANGTLLWSGSIPLPNHIVPIAADIDLDGEMEVIAGGFVYSADGTLLWSMVSPFAGWAATGNFDDDPYAEIVFAVGSQLYLYEHDGTLKWTTKTTWAGGPPTVADFDGDGKPEIGRANSQFYEVVDTDGRLMWRQPIEDSSGVTGSAIFDFDGDGSMEVVHHDEQYIQVFRGSDGELLFRTPLTSSTAVEYAVVADIDSDGHAEIVVASTGLGSVEETRGIRVFGGIDDDWVRAPDTWNQHAYHVTNVNSDLTIPVVEQHNWLTPGLNNYRQNAFTPDNPDKLDRFTYKALAAGQESNIATAYIDILAPNTAPVITSTPDQTATVDYEYLHAIAARDAEFDLLTFALTGGPAAMTIDGPTGLLRWTPGVADLGDHTVTVKVSDVRGLSSLQTYTLTVRGIVVVPDVVGEIRVQAESTLNTEGFLTGRVASFNHPSIPAGSVSGQTPVAGSVAEYGSEVDLLISLGPAPEDVDDDGDGFTENEGDCKDGDDTIFPGAVDIPANGIDEDCDGVDESRPPVEILVLPATATILTDEVLGLSAVGIFDDGTSQNMTAIATWSDGPEYSSPSAGAFVITASKGAVSGAASVTVVARVSGDVILPVAEITTPATNSTVTEPVDITGTATDANFLKYTLGIAPAGEPNFTEITNSTTQVSDDVLGQFDPTMLINDLYTIRLTVFDKGGNRSVAEVTVQVDENMKVGAFSLTYTDLSIPMAGFPITVNRSYDSREKRAGDFGIGWRLDIQTLRLRTNVTLGTGWEVFKSGFSYVLQPTQPHVVSLILPGGRVEEFDLVVSPQVSPVVPFPPSAMQASFVPRAGTRGKIESLANNVLVILEPQPGIVSLVDDSGLKTYDPARFRYTTPEGVSIIVDKASGVESIADINGNLVSFGPGGITHSAGISVTFGRDSQGRITSITDPEGRIQRYGYDANGDLVSHVDKGGYETNFRYNRLHGLIDINDPLGRVVARNEYDSDGRLISTTDGEGNAVTFNHDIAARIETLTDRRGGVSVITYDASGNVLFRTDPAGETWSYTYDSLGRQLTFTDPLSQITAFTYDVLDNITSITDPLGNTVLLNRDAAGRILERTDALGNVTRYKYDARGNRIKEIDALGNEMAYVYDSAGGLTATIDGTGDVDQWQYNSSGQLIGSESSTGQVLNLDIDSTGEVARQRHLVDTLTGPVVVELEYTRDARGLLTGFTSPLAANPMTVSWNAAGEMEGSVDPVGNTIGLVRDLAGRITRSEWSSFPALEMTLDEEGLEVGVALPNGAAVVRQRDTRGLSTDLTIADRGTVTTTWDESGRPKVRQAPGLGPVETVYDAAGRERQTLFSDGSQSQRVFDGNGRVTSSTDTMGVTTMMQYDQRGLVTSVEAGDGRVFERSYNEDGFITSRRDDLGVLWSYEYGAADFISATIDLLGNRTEFEYGPSGRVTRVISPKGEAVRYLFDDGGRLLSTLQMDGTTSNCSYDALARPLACNDGNGDTTTYLYDDNALTHTATRFDGSETGYLDNGGYLVQVDVGGSSYELGRDQTGRLISWSSPLGLVTDTSFAANGGIASRSTQSNVTTSFTYNQRGFLTGTDDPTGHTGITRDAGGRAVTVGFSNSAERQISYDPVGRALHIQYVDATGTTLIALEATVDLLGRIDSLTETGGRTSTYGYDALGRLSHEEITTPSGTTVYDYSYDANSNMIQRMVDGVAQDFIIGEGDLILSDTDSNYAWNANGNLVSRTTATQTEQYTYDSRNRLVRYGRSGVDSVSVEYSYAPDGLLESRSKNGVTTYFTWDRNGPLPLLLEIGGSSRQFMTRYLYDGIFPIAEISSNGEVLHHLRDALGTLRARISEAGVVVEARSYDAFGRQIAGAPSPVGYTGGYEDEDTGLVFLRSRWYSPAMARFTTRDAANIDPLDPRSLNRYTYSFNDPVNRFDPSGQVTLINVMAGLSIAGAVSVIGYALVKDGWDAVTSGFGLFKALLNYGEKKNARFITLRDVLGDRLYVPNIPAKGGVQFGAGPWSVGFGFEFLRFDSPKKDALYFTMGSSVGLVNLEMSSAYSGSSKAVNPSLGSWVSHTPTPRHYEGPFISVEASAVLPTPPMPPGLGGLAATVFGKVTARTGIGGDFFWSPTITYRDPEPDGDPFYSHGRSTGLRGGKPGVTLSLSFTWYGFWKEWRY